MEEVRVDMADFKVASSPACLVATAVGSCVAICLYAQRERCGGLAHAMLPYSDKRNVYNPNRFVNLAVADMITQLEMMGCARELIEAKIVGGANLFPSLLKNEEEQMGYRNVTAVKKILKGLDIRVAGEHTGGNSGRSVRFSLETGIVTVEVKI